MGLDMYMMGRDELHHSDDCHAAGKVSTCGGVELAYWRKHPNLHGYIVQTFAGGVDECQEIPLTLEQVKQTLAASEADQLPQTSGFFFGRSDDEAKVETREQLGLIIKWLEGDRSGKWRKVHYRASW